MFNRLDATYNFDPGVVLPGVFRDEASPLKRIALLISEEAKVLDVGAGSGLLALILAEGRKDVTIDGIEPNPYAAQLARGYYRHFYTGLVEDFIEKIKDEDYDFIVPADVIEHTHDPLSFLNRLASALSEKGRIILTVPNIAFGTIRMNLLNGAFNYVDSGILERTHLRFFTLKTLKQLVDLAGTHIEKLYFLRRNLFDAEVMPEHLEVDLSSLRKILKDELSTTYQFLLVLSKTACATETASFGERIRSPLAHYLVMKLRKGQSLKRMSGPRAALLRLLKA